jgi:hypothetical protein
MNLAPAQLHELADFTYPELRALRESSYRGVLRLYARATAIFGEMGQTATNTPAYAEMDREAKIIMVAAGDNSALFAEVGEELLKRDSI